MPFPITSFTYVSTARVGLDRDDVLDIFTVSKRNNSRYGLTGLLVFNGMNFLQCLEGDRVATVERLHRISLDDRHGGVKVIDKQQSTKRQFSGWYMACRYLPTDLGLGQADLAKMLCDDAVSDITRQNFQNFSALGGHSEVEPM